MLRLASSAHSQRTLSIVIVLSLVTFLWFPLTLPPTSFFSESTSTFMIFTAQIYACIAFKEKRYWDSQSLPMYVTFICNDCIAVKFHISESCFKTIKITAWCTYTSGGACKGPEDTVYTVQCSTALRHASSQTRSSVIALEVQCTCAGLLLCVPNAAVLLLIQELQHSR